MARSLADKFEYLKSLVKEVEAIEQALRPFADLDIHHLKAAADDSPVWEVNETGITVGDIRAAKRAMRMEVPEFDPSRVTAREPLPELGDFSGFNKKRT